MMLVGMSDPGLLILPTHRLVSGYPGLTAAELAKRLEPQFEVQNAGSGETGCRAAWDAIDQGGDQDLLGFGTVADGEWLLARLRSDAAMDRLAPEHSADWRSLGVSVLHVLVLNELLADKGTASCRYVHSIGEVLDRRGRAQLRPGLPRPARPDEPRREHRVQPRNHASQEHLLLSQAPHRAGAQPDSPARLRLAAVGFHFLSTGQTRRSRTCGRCLNFHRVHGSDCR